MCSSMFVYCIDEMVRGFVEVLWPKCGSPSRAGPVHGEGVPQREKSQDIKDSTE